MILVLFFSNLLVSVKDEVKLESRISSIHLQIEMKLQYCGKELDS